MIKVLQAATLAAKFLEGQWVLMALMQLAVPIFLIAYKLPRRSHFWLRLIAGGGAFFVLAELPVATGLVTGLDSVQTFVVFSVLLAVFVVLILFAFDCDPWTALFCATAGYTLQNLASGIEVMTPMVVAEVWEVALRRPWSMFASLAIFAAVYGIGYALFIRRIHRSGLLGAKNQMMLVMFVAVIIIIIGLDIIIKYFTAIGNPTRYLITLRLIFALVCTFVLFTEYALLFGKTMETRVVETEELLAEREHQYQLSRRNIDAINARCHDMRHQICNLAAAGGIVDKSVIASIAHEIEVFDSVVETGNEALDTILTEKTFAYSAEGITLACIADGTSLDFMAPIDIYAFFGNALDNAFEAARQLNDPEHRTVALNVQRRGQMVSVNIENYCRRGPLGGSEGPSGAVAGSQDFVVGSMRAIAERYDGTLHTGIEGGVYYLNALIPRPA